MAYGVTTDGFVIKPLDVIKEEIEDSQKADINPALNQTATSVLGQLNGIFAAKCRELWELAQFAYNAYNPDAAEGAVLDNLVALCPGIIRRAATKSRVTATYNVDGPATYPAGTLVANVVGNADATFVNTEDVVNPWGTPQNIDAVAEAEQTGPIPAPAGTLTEINQPVTGWNSVTNAADAELGEDIESDAELRLRREAEIRRTGSANVDAIRADVLEVTGVLFCLVYENKLDVAVPDLVPHSIRVVIWDGDPAGADDLEVAEAIFDSKAAGIDTNGVVVETVEDSQGFDHTIKFDRATEKTIEIQLTVDLEDEYPADWQDQIKAALVAYTDSEQGIAADVIYSKLLGVAVEFEFVNDITLFQIRFTGDSWGVINLPVGNDEIATLDSGDISFV